MPGSLSFRTDDFKPNHVCFACQHKPKSPVLYNESDFQHSLDVFTDKMFKKPS